jgi:uncharacterized YccA/Bax inhibitor family protein
MSLFKSGNPTLSLSRFETGTSPYAGEVMTARGAMNKFGFLFLMVMGTSFYSWKELADGGNVMPLLWTGMIGGLIVAIVITFKKEWSPFLAPAYGLLEGLFIGSISAIYNQAFAKIAPDLIMNAVGLTFGTAIAMYFLYTAKIIRATEKFKAIIITATVGIMIFYLITMLISLFGVHIAFMSSTNGSMMGIGISLVIVVIAAMNLILDFDMIEQGAANGAPKYMEWYCAFGLMVTIVWLYLEILRLLAKISSRR